MTLNYYLCFLDLWISPTLSVLHFCYVPLLNFLSIKLLCHGFFKKSFRINSNSLILFPQLLIYYWFILEAVVQECSVKKVFLEISENSQENPCARVSFLIKLQAGPRSRLAWDQIKYWWNHLKTTWLWKNVITPFH